MTIGNECMDLGGLLAGHVLMLSPNGEGDSNIPDHFQWDVSQANTPNNPSVCSVHMDIQALAAGWLRVGIP